MWRELAVKSAERDAVKSAERDAVKSAERDADAIVIVEHDHANDGDNLGYVDEHSDINDKRVDDQQRVDVESVDDNWDNDEQDDRNQHHTDHDQFPRPPATRWWWQWRQ